MYLWTEFEGSTIDSAFPLTKLVQTEGRSAFFSTRNANGESVLIRIIECHFDEDEIQARWRGLQTLNHPNFLRIDRFGKFYMAADDITAVYVVFERVDANLDEVLERGSLSAAEATQIGLSVTSALETLHAAGFVHEHIESRNIYAVGEKVKLRSDCIRETPEGEAGIEARRRDVHEIAVTLMEVLLGKNRASSASPSMLPAPFDEIVRNGLNASWGLAEIQAALVRVEGGKGAGQKSKRAEPEILKSAAPKPLPLATQPGAMTAPRAASESSSKSGSTSDSRSAASGASDSSTARQLSFDEIDGARTAELNPRRERVESSAFNDAKFAGFTRKKSSLELPVIFGLSEREFRKWLAAGTLLLGVVLVCWILLHHWLGRSSGGAAQSGSTQTPAESSYTAATPKTADSSSAARAPKAGSQTKVEWRVVAFTYNRQDQAQKKASSLALQHPGLAPAVFSPTGKAPWLVTIGGVLKRDAAYALARKAQSLGLPHDTYAQDYNVR